MGLDYNKLKTEIDNYFDNLTEEDVERLRKKIF